MSTMRHPNAGAICGGDQITRSVWNGRPPTDWMGIIGGRWNVRLRVATVRDLDSIAWSLSRDDLRRFACDCKWAERCNGKNPKSEIRKIDGRRRADFGIR